MELEAALGKLSIGSPLTYNTCSPIHKQLVELFNMLFIRPFAEESYHIQYSKLSWPQDGSPFEFDITKLTVTETIDKIVDGYEQHGVIVLRKYNGEEYCTIGCGNKPLANSGGYPLRDNEEEEYHALHHHTGHYTINPEPSYNPSVVGFFSKQTFGNIPDNSFTEIYSEGICLDETDLYFSEIWRMLKDGGKMICDGNHTMTKIDHRLVLVDIK